MLTLEHRGIGTGKSLPASLSPPNGRDLRVVITGITGLRNRGVEAMVSVTLAQLKARVPHVQVSLLTPTPDFDQRAVGEGAAAIDCQTADFPAGFRGHLKEAAKRLVGGRRSREARRVLAQADCVIASGGDLFASCYGSCERHLRPLILAQRMGVPVVFLAHSFGPFTTSREADAWLAVARRSPLLTAREPVSRDYVMRELGFPEASIPLTADVAFLLEPPGHEKTRQLRAAYGIDGAGPVVAVAPSQGMSRYSRTNRDDRLTAWSAAIRYIRTELGARVIIVPHVQDPCVANDDSIFATDLLRRLAWDPKITLLAAVHSASEFKGLIAGCDLVVAERMHAAIAGLGSGSATLVIAYSLKATGIIRDIFGSECAPYLAEAGAFANAEKAVDAVRTAWKFRAHAEAILRNRIPKIRARAGRNFELLSDLLLLRA